MNYFLNFVTIKRYSSFFMFEKANKIIQHPEQYSQNEKAEILTQLNSFLDVLKE